MKTAVVTGASGFIGNALVKLLLKNNVKVYAVSNKLQNIEILKPLGDLIFVKASYSDYNNLHEKIDDHIDVFYHFAWQGGFTENFKNYSMQLDNARAACDALMLALKIGAKKFVYPGTKNQYQLSNFSNPLDFFPRYTYIYATTKLTAELMCRTLACQNNIEFCSGLLAMSYGEGNLTKQLPNIIINQLLKNQRPKLTEGKDLYDLIYIDDIAKAFYAIGDKGIDKNSYYVGNRKLKTFKELIIDIKDIIRPDMDLVFGEISEDASIDYSSIDLDALYNDTGFECTSDFRENILKTAEWVKQLNF